MTPLLSNQLLRTQSDGRLTALAAAGHDRAFEAIVDRYRQPLSRYLRRLLSEALAEDVLQATFVRAWQALATGSEVRDLRPWLYRIAHNQALNALRAATASLPHATDLVDASGAVPTMSTEGEVERREELRHTLSGIGALPDRQRAALVAVAVADRPHSDVAAELGLTDGALRQLLLRARTALRAAATAITPYPLVGWLSAGQEASAARVAEVAAGAGGAGLGLKAGAAVLAAGAVVAGAPALRDEHAPARATRSSSTTTQTKPTAAATLIGDHRGGAQAKAADDRGTGSGSGVSVVHRASASSGHSGSQTPHRSSSGSSGSGSGESGSGTDDSSSEAHRSGSSSDDSGAEFKGSNSRDESSDDHAVSSGDNELSQRSGSEDHPDESPSTGQGSEETAGTPTTPSPPPAAGEGDGSGHVEDTSPSGSGGD